jgi:hypothetical protein
LLPDGSAMQKRHLVVGAVMVLASVVSFHVVQTTQAPAAIEVVEAGRPASVMSATAPLPVTSASDDLGDVVTSVSDITTMFAIGAALLGLAAGVRRHTC